MSIPTARDELTKRSGSVRAVVETHLDETGGLLRHALCRVPRSFLQPEKRPKLRSDDLDAFGLNRGGNDERWLESTSEAATDDREEGEGLSPVVVGNEYFTLEEAIDECGPEVNPNAQRWVLTRRVDN